MLKQSLSDWRNRYLEKIQRVSEGKEQYGEVNNEIYSSTTLASALFMFSSSLLDYLLYFAILGKHKVTEVLNSDAMKYL